MGELPQRRRKTGFYAVDRRKSAARRRADLLAAAVLGFAPDGCDMRPAVTRSAHQAVEAVRLQHDEAVRLQQDEADAAWQAAYGKMGDGERMRGVVYE